MRQAHQAHQAQIAQPSALSGRTFETRFLPLMIDHHQGATEMVTALRSVSGAVGGAARNPMLFQFVREIDVDQRAEIQRMRALLAQPTVIQPPKTSKDPRVSLRAGFQDAQQSIKNLVLIS